MNTTMKRVLSLLLCFVLATSYLPVGAFATETGETVVTEATEVTTAPTETSEETEATSAPTEAPTEPSTEATEPSTEATEPSTEATEPSTEATEPSTEVTEPEVVAVTGITLDRTALEVGVGELPMTLTATVLPEDATDKTVTWISSEPGVVSVENGVLTFGYMGTATVTATAGDFSAECTVTVGEGESASYDLEGVVDAAIFFADLHTNESNYKESTVKGVMNALKNTGLPFSSVTSAGDAFSVNADNTKYTGDPTKITGYIQSVFSGIPVNYVWSDHDRYATGIEKTSRLVYGAGNDGVYGTDDDGNYYVYALSMGDLCSYDRYKAGFNYTESNNSGRVAAGFTATVSQAIEVFEADAAKLKKDRPLFIVSHQPLFDNRNDNAWAENWFDAINKVAEDMDVAFFYGHNHKYDKASDYYYAKGTTMPVATADKWGWDYDIGEGYLPSMDLSSESKTLNFTHLCAGYLAPSSTGSTSGTTREGTLLAVTIFEDSIQYVTYNANGEYTGNYAVNETVEREHTAPAVTLTGINVEGQTEYTVGDAFVTPTVTAVYSDNSTKNITSECTFSGYDMATVGTQTVTVTWGEVTTTYEITVKDFEIPEDYALARIEVVNQGNTKYFLNETLNTENLTVEAVYTKEDAADVRKTLTLQTAENEDGFTVSGFDMTKAGKQYVTVTYGECVGTFAIEVYQTHFENETGTVAVDFNNYGITSVTIAEAAKEVEGYSAYVTYDITPVGYTQGDEATGPVGLNNGLCDEARPVKVLDQGDVIATPEIVEGKITFTTTHFSEYDVAQIDADAQNWVEIPGENKTIFRLTNSLTANKKYVIVSTNAAGAATAVNLNGNNINTASVTVIADTAGNYIEAPATSAQWTFNSSNKLQNVATTGRYLRGDNANNDSLRTTNNVNDNQTSWSYNQNNGLYTTRRNSNWYVNSSFKILQNGSSTNRVYLYVEEQISTVATYAALGGQQNQSYATADNTSLETILGKLVVYTRANETATPATVAVTSAMVTWNKEFDGSTAGTYTGTVKYNNVNLGTVTVTVTEKSATKVELLQYEGQVERDSGADVVTGAYLNVTWNDGNTEQIPVKVGMLSGSGLNVNKNGTYSGLTVSYGGKTAEGTFTLKVVNKTGVDDFPLYPNPGSIDLQKTATGVDFQNTGIARVELSTSGLPATAGADVIIMLDTSSSMTKNEVEGSGGKKRSDVLEESLKDLIEQFKTGGPGGTPLDLKVAIADFNGYYGDGSGGTSNTPYDRTSGDYVKNGNSNGSGYQQPSEARVYTGTNNLTAGAFIQAGDLAESYTLNYTSGTNYDYAFDAIYQLGTAIKQANGDNHRPLYVIFMSDGASLQWNYFGTQNSYTKWNSWLTGAWDADDLTTSNLNSTAHSYFYDLNDHDGDGQINEHRMANAIKGDPDQRYEVIRKSTAGLPEGTLVSAGKNYLYTVPGLGATMFTINFDAKQDGQITEDSIDKALSSTASDQTGAVQYYYKVTKAGDLESAFQSIGSEIAYAASNARFVDQMGDSFNLQMNPTIKTNNKENTNGTTTTTTDITITTRPVYTKEQVGKTVDGHTVTKDDVGKPYGNGTPVETVKFAVDKNGTITATTTASGYTLPDGTAVTANSTNILVGGVLYGKNFFYNNNNTAVTVTLANGSTVSLPGETFYWNIGTINETQYTISYTVYLEGSMDGNAPPADSYATNNFAILYYTNHEGNEVSKSVASPTIAWEGANVSYAFYLVDDEGNPVHADGTAAQNFLQAHKITQPVVYQSVKLNDNAGTTLSAAALAVLPSGYELYAPGATYTVVIGSGDAAGSTTSQWTITGDEDKTTYVVGYGGANDYSNVQIVNDTSYDYTHTTVYFAVKWVIGAVQDTVVIDYGLPVDINVMANDMFGTAGTLYAVGKRENKPEGHGSSLANGFSTESVAGDYGTAVIKDGKIRYTLSDMQIKGAEKLSYAVDYEGEANKGFYYGDLTIIPATTVYYEDEYVTLKTYTRPDTNTTNYTAKDGWPTNSKEASGTQAEDRPGSFNLGIIDANNIYGYDQAYEQMSTHSMGNSAMIHVDAKQYGTAEFTFWGTGFDVISTTSNETGTLVVQIYNANNELVTSKAVDTYYGYVYGLYSVTYQKNTDGIWEMVGVGDAAPADVKSQTKEEITSGTPNTDGTVTGYHYTWKAVNNNPNALYQVPVIKHSLKDYGKYTVKITALYYETFDATTDPGYDLYLDAIRIYDPAGTGNEVISSNNDKDTTIADIYAQDGEAWPSYHELRNLIIKAATFDSLGAEDEVEGIIFIDGDATLGEGSTVTGNAITDYINYGPNNELYLAAGQAVAFNMNLGSANDHDGYVPVVRIGMKTVGGKTAVAELWNAVENTDGTVSRYNAISDTLQTATDMYYDITVLNGRTVVIKNSGEDGSILSITNIKLTYKPTVTSTAGINEANVVNETEQPAPLKFSISRSAANVALMSLKPIDEEVPDEVEPTEPEGTEPTEPETEPTEPEVTEPAKPNKPGKPGQEATTDVTELKDAVEEAKKLNEKDYTKESFKAVKTALKDAEKVLKSKKATQAEIDEALAELNEAVEALEVNAPATKPGKHEKEEKPAKPSKPEEEEKPAESTKPGNSNKPAKDEKPAQGKAPTHSGVEEIANQIKNAVAWLLDWLN